MIGLMLAFDAPSGIIGWITVVIAVLGLCLFFSDLIINIKKRRNTRLNIIGLVFISLSLVCFVLTMLFTEMVIFMYISIAFLAGYLVCDVIVAVCIAKQNKRDGKPIWRKPKKQQSQAANDGEVPLPASQTASDTVGSAPTEAPESTTDAQQ